MTIKENDREFQNLISELMDSEEFKRLEECRHHGISRMLHSKRVAYFSYKIAKKLKLDYQSVARGGLLHDYFIDISATSKEKHRNIFIHPKTALNNSTKLFNLNDTEKDIILSHMFPLMPVYVPKYLESWLVSMVDKIVATYEFGMTFFCHYKYVNQIAVLLLIIGRRL